MTKRLKVFAILSIALLLSCCFIFAGCKDRTKDKKDEIVIPEEAIEAPTIKSLVVEEKEDFEVKDDVVHLYENDFTFKDGHIIVDKLHDLSIGRVVLLDYDGKQDQAYRITDYDTYGNNYMFGITPNVDVYSVYDQIEVSKSVALTDEDATIDFIDDADLIAQFMQTELAFGIEGLFGTPNVSIPNKEINKEAGYAKIALKITFPVYNANGVASEVSILLDNTIFVESDCTFNLVPLKFDLGADMLVITDTTFSIDFGYGISGQENAEDVATKLLELLGYNPSEFNLTIFSWSYPVGPLLLSYDLDVKFNVKFEGQFNMTATSQLECYLGASYDTETAKANDENDFKVVFEKGEANYFKLTRANLYGTLNAAAGVVNTLRLDILAVAGVGLKLDMGIYADLYGAVEFNLDNIKESNGGYYFEPGFYYSVDVLAGANIANIIKLNKNFNLVNGKIAFPHLIAGEKTFVVAFNDATERVDLVSSNYVLPTAEVKFYNLITRAFEYQTITYNDLVINLAENSNFTYDDGVLTVKDNIDALEEDIIITLAANPKIHKTIKFVKTSTLPCVAESVLSYTKGSPYDIEFIVDPKDEEILEVIGNNVEATIRENKVIINHIYLCTLANDRYEFTIRLTEHEIKVYVNVNGTVNLFSSGEGTKVSPYLIYSTDQLVELANNVGRNNYYNFKYFKLVYDLDFNGTEFNPIANFAGTFDGNNKTISNFVITSTNDGYAGLFAKNSGTIKNLTVDCKIEINEQLITAGAIAGKNYGKIDNVAAYGSISATFKTTTSKHNKFVVGGIVGENTANGEVSNVSAYNKIVAKTTGINSASNIIYIAGVVAYNEGTALENINGADAELDYEDAWYKLNKVFSNQTINNIK